MKTVFIVALAGTLLSGLAQHSLAGTPEEEAKKEAEVLFYSLTASWNEFQHANDAILNSPGSHRDIQADYEYFYEQLSKDIRPAADKDAVIMELRKSYARKHKMRAEEELQKQKKLIQFMEQRLAQHQLQFKAFASKYKAVLAKQIIPEVDTLKEKLSISASDLQQKTENYTKTAAKYDEAYKKLKKGFV